METTCIAFLRGINVSGKNIILMDDLQKLFEKMGFTNVKTYIQSGNIIFKSKNNTTSDIKQLIEKNIKIKFGFDVETILKTLKELKNIIDGLPYKLDDLKEKERIYITLLSQNLDKGKTRIQMKSSDGIDDYSAIKSEIYILCRGGYGKTKFSNSYFEKNLGIPATTRNWETINKVYNLAESN